MNARLRTHPSGPPARALATHGGVGRSSSRYAERVSDALRRMDSPTLRRRRAATGLTLVATLALMVVDAYQTGLLRRVPEPRVRGLNADRVDASGEAYRMLATPDAGTGITSYGLTLLLLGAGAEHRADSRPWLPLLTAAKVAADAAVSGYLFAEQLSKHRAVCGWCTVAGVASWASVPLVFPEAWNAWRTLRSSR